MEPSPGLEPGTSFVPGTRSGHWSYEGMSWAPRTRTWKLSVQSRAGLPVPPPPIASRHSVSSRTACFTRAGPQPCVAARVSPARLERALPATSRPCLLPLGYEDMEPIPGVEPGRPPYEGGAAGRAHRRGWPSWSRTRKLRVQSAAGLPNSPNGHRVRETRVERASGPF